jgi:Amt family ammonium transporter
MVSVKKRLSTHLQTPIAFFYGGMVRVKNVLSTLFQNFAALGAIGLVWGAVGYSLAFSSQGNGFIGNLNFAFMNGVGQNPNADYSSTIPHVAFMLFQCMFAVITPALITGAIAERLNFKAWVSILVLWSVFVYSPVAHWVWAVGGWIRELGGLDFAGGLVVHMTAGYSALALAVLLGRRKVFGQESRPYDPSYVILGTGLLWFGWFGFNGGSALGANGLAAHACATTFFAAAAAGVAWATVDTLSKGKPSAIGGSVGVVAGLVAITPAAGFVPIWSSFIIGAVTGVACNLTAGFVRRQLKLDDTLDVFACHGLGGTIGAILTGVFTSKLVNPAGANGVIYGDWTTLKANLIGSVAVIAYSVVVSLIIYKVLSLFMSMRVSEEQEEAGLDNSQHGEFINSEIIAYIEEMNDQEKNQFIA